MNFSKEPASSSPPATASLVQTESPASVYPVPGDEVAALRAALQEANERNASLLRGITDGFTVIDRDWRISSINAQADALLRTAESPLAPLAGQDLWLAFPALQGSAMEVQLSQALARQQTAAFELCYAKAQRWLEVRAYPSAAGLSCYIQDISQRKHDERALRHSARRLRVALAAGKLGDWSWDAVSDRVTLGRRAASLFGLAADQPVGWDALRARMLPEDREPARQAFLRAYAGHTDFVIECRLDDTGGERRWLAVMGHSDYSDDGALLGMTGMVQDISARKLADQALRESEEQLRALANAIPQLAWIADREGKMVWYNERWYAYTGTAPQQPPTGNWPDVYAPDCLAQMTARWQASQDSGAPFEMEVPIRGADGQYRWFLTRANPVRDSAGQVLRWFGTSTDVDQVKRVQEALRDETSVLELLNSTGNALASTRDLPPLLQEVTDAATRISGARFGAFYYYSDDSDGAPHMLHALSGSAPAQFANFGRPRASALFGSTLRGEGTVRSDDLLLDPRYALSLPGARTGAAPPVRSYLAVPVMLRSGEVVGSLYFGHPEAGMFSERTERIIGAIAAQAAVAIDNARLYAAAQRAAEERKVLLDSERRARAESERNSQMKDEFLATLSHELRTPLTAILGWAQVLRRGSRDQADLHRGLQTIERNARVQAQLIEDLLDMSRITSGKVQLELQSVSPLAVADAAIDAVRPAADAKQIRLLRQFEPQAGPVAADPARLQQVIWNLLNNALKFTPAGGTVLVRVARAGAHLEIEVRDNGIGIAPDFLAHVFERFRQADASTTRHHGGLGLGLAIVQQLVEQQGGTVSALSAGAGHGASFTVRLPLATQAQALALAPARAATPVPTTPVSMTAFAADVPAPDLSGLCVLVVDDEVDARELIRRILSDCHASVLTAASASEALRLLQLRRPDLLVSDIGMPGMDGFELLQHVRALGAAGGGDLPAIALTAFAHTEDRDRALAGGFGAHLAKPVEPAALVATVADMGYALRTG